MIKVRTILFDQAQLEYDIKTNIFSLRARIYGRTHGGLSSELHHALLLPSWQEFGALRHLRSSWILVETDPARFSPVPERKRQKMQSELGQRLPQVKWSQP
jgi:hypothetical protein